MTFRVGQKVVCVDNNAWYGPHGDGLEPLTKGRIYTVIAVDVCLFANPACKVSELHSKHWMRQSRFRPIVERKTDISIFTQMLKPSKVKA